VHWRAGCPSVGAGAQLEVGSLRQDAVRGENLQCFGGLPRVLVESVVSPGCFLSARLGHEEYPRVHLTVGAQSAVSMSSGPLFRTLFTLVLTILGVRVGSGRESSRCWTSFLSVRSGSSHSAKRSRGMMTGERSWTCLIWGWPDGESRRRGAEIRPCLPFILGV
jgi:uncharacterized membrane protein